MWQPDFGLVDLGKMLLKEYLLLSKIGLDKSENKRQKKEKEKERKRKKRRKKSENKRLRVVGP